MLEKSSIFTKSILAKNEVAWKRPQKQRRWRY